MSRHYAPVAAAALLACALASAAACAGSGQGADGVGRSRTPAALVTARQSGDATVLSVYTGTAARTVRTFPGTRLAQLEASPDGRLVSAEASSATGITTTIFDVASARTLRALPEPLISAAGAGPTTEWAPRSGQLVTSVIDPASSQARIRLYAADGRDVTPTALRDVQAAEADWSPDGREIVLVRGEEFTTLSVFDLGTQQLRDLVSGTRTIVMPAWSPAGGQVAYWTQADVPGDSAVSVVDVRSGTTRLMAKAPLWLSRHAWSPDGRRLALACADSSDGSRSSACIADLRTNIVTRISNDGQDSSVAFSPDGSRVSYLSGAYPSTLRVFDVAARKTVTVATSLTLGGYAWLR